MFTSYKKNSHLYLALHNNINATIKKQLTMLCDISIFNAHGKEVNTT